jgi:hypothetical protein
MKKIIINLSFIGFLLSCGSAQDQGLENSSTKNQQSSAVKCDKIVPNVFMLLDTSLRMDSDMGVGYQDGFDTGKKTRWEATKKSLKKTMPHWKNSMNLGIMFSNPVSTGKAKSSPANNCATGEMILPGSSNYGQIVS